MDVLVRNAEGNVSLKDREYAARKLGGLDRYFHQAQKVEMVHREAPNGTHRIEITVFADGFTIRGEDTEPTIQAAIDRVHDKLESRLRKLKSRLIDSHRRKGTQAPPALAPEPHEEMGEMMQNNHHLDVKERKSFRLKPMSMEEAALQMDLVDHPFFVFRNEASGAVEVLYRRNDGRYGLLQPELD
ncbi:MAG: ribosome-associated translation inhibitor RaiA [Fimbriimonadaceae bacterium]